tara:strand:+ start:537 stop:734 length:198 start_codon:yes stop_codon:yes gene_type:complete
MEALKALMKAVHSAAGIPLKTPKATTTYRTAVNGTYRGFISHFHLKKNKIDCAGLNIEELIKAIE